jgi:AcrR family transcriptional regulator
MPGQRETEATRREQILKAAYQVALRRGIDGLTLRAVAARARLSHGLVLFHFKRKDQLGLALLDRVLAATISLTVADKVRSGGDPGERMLAVVRQELDRLSQAPRRLRLLLEYWARGGHNPVIRAKIGAGLQRYRAAFEAMAEQCAANEEGPVGAAAPAGVAAAVVSLLIGFPVQAMIDPGTLDPGDYLAVIHGTLGRPGIAA